MSRHLNDIKNKLSYLNSNINVLDLLMEFERTIDNANVYAYKNWINGEIVEGPNIERYWVTVKLMFPYTMMPDPMGGMRLTKYGCKLSYEKDIFEAPVRIRGKESYSDFSRKKAKLKKHKVWIVTICMPKRYLDERLLDIISSNDDENSLDVNVDDVSAAYDANVESAEDIGGGADLGGEGGDDAGMDEDFSSLEGM